MQTRLPNTDHTLDRPEPKPVWVQLQHALQERVRQVEEHSRALHGFKRLLAMQDHMLQDIGLTRTEILQDRLRYRLTGELPDYNS